jgi:hypothetical protein
MSVIRWVLVAMAALDRRRLDCQLRRRATGRRRSRDTLRGAALAPARCTRQIIQDHPGECPICDMTLVPKLGRQRRQADAGRGCRPASPA